MRGNQMSIEKSIRVTFKMFFKLTRAVFSTRIIKINSGTSNNVANGILSIKYPVTRSLSSAPSKPKTAPPVSSEPRIARQEPGPVRLGFIPDEWMMFFYKKTGTSGLGTLCFTVMITLMSKEYYVMEHEYYGGLSMIALCVLIVRYGGPGIAKVIDKGIDAYEEGWTNITTQKKAFLEEAITHENKLQLSMEGQLMIVEAKRENVALQLEAAYRQRLMTAYNETKRRLDYCRQREAAEKALAKRYMSDWVIKEVRNAVTKEIEEQALAKCYEDLKILAKAYTGLSTPYEPVDPQTKPPDPTDPPKKGKK